MKRSYCTYCNIYHNLKIWRKENKRLHLLSKEYLLGSYDEDAFYLYLKFLNYKFFIPIKYQFLLTNSMKIKAYLWTSPIIVRKEEEPLIELRPINERIKELTKLKVNYTKWKVLKFSKRIPRLLYRSKYVI